MAMLGGGLCGLKEALMWKEEEEGQGSWRPLSRGWLSQAVLLAREMGCPLGTGTVFQHHFCLPSFNRSVPWSFGLLFPHVGF